MMLPVFWILAGLLTLLALALTLLPLLRRNADPSVDAQQIQIALHRTQSAELERDLAQGLLDPSQFEHSRLELDRRLLVDTAGSMSPSAPMPRPKRLWIAAALALAGAGFSVGLYSWLGNPQSISPAITSAAAAHAGNHDLERIDGVVDRLAQRLATQTPNDGRAWALLARSYVEAQRHAEAIPAFDKALALLGDDAQLLADYADALAVLQDGSLQGEPFELVRRALKADPGNDKALALAATAEFDRKHFAQAIQYWERQLTALPQASADDAEAKREILANIAEAKALLRGAAPSSATLAAALQASDADHATPGGAGVSGTVTLAPGLQKRVQAGERLFVFARAVGGPKMPLAVLNVAAENLPYPFSLDDTMAMMPQLKLSNFREILLVARISKSGSAIAQSGDLQGGSRILHPGARGVTLVIDSVVP